MQKDSLGELTPHYLAYALGELQFAKQTVEKYKDCLRQVGKLLGDRPVATYTKQDVLTLKTKLIERGNGVSRQLQIVAALKGMIRFAKDELDLPVLDPDLITLPKRRTRPPVIFLTPSEVEQFVASIPVTTLRDKRCWHGLRLRALVEMLLGSALRIGELLALDQEDVDFEEREASIVGKGGRPRTVFFTDRALYWLRQYLDYRTDSHPALFVTKGGRSRVARADVSGYFARARRRAGLKKRVTPHILRHTAATQLLFNGCPIGHIKEILGHQRLETTCRYYLGSDIRAAKAAHGRYLVYEATSDGA